MHPSAISLFFVLLVFLQVQEEEATFAIAIPAITLTATQFTALAAFGALAKLGGIGAGLALASGGSSRSSSSRSSGYRRYTHRHSHRGRRDSDEEKITLEKLSTIEPENCFKMVFCATSTGKYDS